MKRSLFLFAILGLISSAKADVVLTMGGDVNFNRNRLAAEPNGIRYGQTVSPWATHTKNLKGLINGDLNFANIETVVTSHSDLLHQEKKFAFMSHINSMRHLIGLGFNFFNLANNHSFDYGIPGVHETLSSFKDLQSESPGIVYGGIGYRSDILRPKVFEKNGIRFAFASVSIADGYRATNQTPGVLYIRNDQDYRDLMMAFKKTDADFKILSTHVGVEGQNNLDPGQQARFRYAIDYGGVDLIIGHHPHVVRPIEKYKNSWIFYSLGNYLMLGSADMTKKADINQDWGMFARLYLERDYSTGKVRVEAAEVIPLTYTHSYSLPMVANKAAQRIASFNELTHRQLGDEGVRLSVDKILGKGIFCSGSERSIRAKVMCASSFNYE